MNNKKRVLIVTNDIECARNIQYCSKIESYFKKNGWEISEGFENIDKVIICACGYHNAQYNKALKVITKLRENNFNEKNIVLMGCLPKTHEKDINEKLNCSIVYLNQEEKLDEITGASVSFRSVADSNLFTVYQQDTVNKKNNGFYIKVGEGCLGACTYCVIKRAKGSLKSIPAEDIISQYRTAIENGYRKIQLIGEDTMAYGSDTGTTIIELINTLLSIDKNVEIYLGSVDIKWLKKYNNEFIDLCKQGIIKKLNIGLQHVNDDILKRMGRGGTRFSEAYEILKEIRRECPDIFISADIIVGFPGETIEAFEELAEFLKQDTCFDSIKHSGYSDNEYAPSFKLDNKIDPLDIVDRFYRLNDILEGKSMINFANSPDSESITYLKTFEENVFIIKNSYLSI